MTSSILTLGTYRQTAVVVRALARQGMHVICGTDGGNADFVASSRFVREVWLHPPLAPPRAAVSPALEETAAGSRSGSAAGGDFAAALQAFLARRPEIAWLFPVGEDMLQFFLQHSQANAGRMLVMPEADIIAQCLNKMAMYQMAEALGVPLARYIEVRHAGDLADAVAEVGFPCVIKPNHSLMPFGDVKALIAHMPGDVDRALSLWPEDGGTCVVQQWAPGQRHNCHFAAVDGNVVAYFEQRVLRTDRLDATGYGVDGVSVAADPALRRHTGALAGKLRYTGIGCAQFLRDDGGRAAFLELNPRLDATCALPYYCGYDFPSLALACAIRRHGQEADLPWVPASYDVGVRVNWFSGDLQGFLRAQRQGELDPGTTWRWLMQMVSSAVRADCHVLWSVSDPAPALVSYGRWLARSLERRLRLAQK